MLPFIYYFHSMWHTVVTHNINHQMNQSTKMACDFSMKSFSISRYIISSVIEGGKEDWMLPAHLNLWPFSHKLPSSSLRPEQNIISMDQLLYWACVCADTLCCIQSLLSTHSRFTINYLKWLNTFKTYKQLCLVNNCKNGHTSLTTL